MVSISKFKLYNTGKVYNPLPPPEYNDAIQFVNVQEWSLLREQEANPIFVDKSVPLTFKEHGTYTNHPVFEFGIHMPSVHSQVGMNFVIEILFPQDLSIIPGFCLTSLDTREIIHQTNKHIHVYGATGHYQDKDNSLVKRLICAVRRDEYGNEVMKLNYKGKVFTYGTIYNSYILPWVSNFALFLETNGQHSGPWQLEG